MEEGESGVLPGRIEVVEARAGVAVVELVGEHDLAGSHELEFLLESLVGSNHLVVVDLSCSTFVDSSVVRALLRAERLAKAQRTTFRLQFGTAPIVRRALELTGVLDYLGSVRTREEALREAEDGAEDEDEDGFV